MVNMWQNCFPMVSVILRKINGDKMGESYPNRLEVLALVFWSQISKIYTNLSPISAYKQPYKLALLFLILINYKTTYNSHWIEPIKSKFKTKN